MVALALLHSALFSWRLATGFDGDNRARVIAWLEEQAETRRGRGRPTRDPLTVGILTFHRKFEGIWTAIDASPVLRRQGVSPPIERWKDRPDFIVLSTPLQLRLLRREAGEQETFWRDLTNGELGYRLTHTFEPAFRAEGVFSVADPLIAHAWGNGDFGFHVYERVGGPGVREALSKRR